jgi:hypothetical protein
MCCEALCTALVVRRKRSMEFVIEQTVDAGRRAGLAQRLEWPKRRSDSGCLLQACGIPLRGIYLRYDIGVRHYDSCCQKKDVPHA